jgi:hypothetical protein
MNIRNPVADSPDLVESNCPNCLTPVPIPCIPRVNTSEDLDRLLAGTLNTAPCASCGTPVTSDRPVHIDIPELGIGQLRYAPLDLLEDDSVCELLLEERQYQLLFYSLGELANQVRARVRLSQFSPNGTGKDDRIPFHRRPAMLKIAEK